jgi:hypothetical protein
MSGNRRLLTLSVLFVAVLIAYRQRNAPAKTGTTSNVKDHSEPGTNRYYPKDTHSHHDTSRFAEEIRRSTESHYSFEDPIYTTIPGAHRNSYGQGNPHMPHSPIGRQLPKEVFKFLHRLPFIVFPYIYRIIASIFHGIYVVILFLLPIVIQPLKLLFGTLSTLLQPMITLLQGLYQYLVLVPLGVALYFGGLLYPFYVFGVVAILVGGFFGACGGLIHGGLIGPWTGDKRKEAKEEVHREMEELLEGRGRGRDRASIKPAKLSKGKERDLRGWREGVW